MSVHFMYFLLKWKGVKLWFYHLRQLLYRNYHSITKKSRAIGYHSLFPAWECKQTWLLLNFVPTIDFTSSQSSISCMKSENSILSKLIVIWNFCVIWVISQRFRCKELKPMFLLVCFAQLADQNTEKSRGNHWDCSS